MIYKAPKSQKESGRITISIEDIDQTRILGCRKNNLLCISTSVLLGATAPLWEICYTTYDQPAVHFRGLKLVFIKTNIWSYSFKLTSVRQIIFLTQTSRRPHADEKNNNKEK